jgi:methylated-DNA-[protein]-cysteine S-methyltransferase
MVKPSELYYSVIKTGWGQIVAIWSDSGLWELSFPQPEELAAADIPPGMSELSAEQEAYLWSEQLATELRTYFQGFPVTFGVPIDWRSYTAFQKAALLYTADIPYGATASYQTVAQAIGSPKAVRAVGGAMHSNRTPLVVPCHRVVGANGSLTGFGGGLDLKKALLLLESGE